MRTLPRILITCTQPRADEIVRDLCQSGLNCVAQPALRVQPIESVMPEGTFDAMVISSRHAVCDKLPDLPVTAVGEATGRLLEKAGFTVAQTGCGGVADLTLKDDHIYLYPCAHNPTIIPDNAVAWPIYKTEVNQEFSLNDADIITVFSAKAARVISQHDLTGRVVLCLSDAVAKPLKASGAKALVVCERSAYDAMNDLIFKTVRQI